jgi:hypothetical protein
VSSSTSAMLWRRQYGRSTSFRGKRYSRSVLGERPRPRTEARKSSASWLISATLEGIVEETPPKPKPTYANESTDEGATDWTNPLHPNTDSEKCKCWWARLASNQRPADYELSAGLRRGRIFAAPASSATGCLLSLNRFRGWPIRWSHQDVLSVALIDRELSRPAPSAETGALGLVSAVVHRTPAAAPGARRVDEQNGALRTRTLPDPPDDAPRRI